MNKNIEQLIKISQENPELEIIIMVDYEVCASDEHRYWLSEIDKIEIDDYWIAEEVVFLGEESIKEELDGQGIEEIDSEYLILKAKDTIRRAIIIYIGQIKG